MSKFYISIQKIRKLALQFAQAAVELERLAGELETIINVLSSMPSYRDIVDALRALQKEILRQARNARRISEGLIDICKEYESTETDIYNYIKKAEETLHGHSHGGSPDGTNGHEHGGGSGSFDEDDEDNEVIDYLLTALKQLLLGDFTEDSNLLGTIASVILGFVPYAGQVADVRDLIADIYNLIDDGPTTMEWVNLGFTLVGIIPGIGDLLKHGDEMADLLKHADNLDEIAELVGTGMKKGDEVFSEIGKHIDELTKAFKNSDPVKAVEKYVEGLGENMPEVVKNLKKNFDEFLDKDLIYNPKNTNKEFIKKMIEKATGLEQKEKEIITDAIDWYKEQVEEFINNTSPLFMSISGFESALDG